jgi:enoyl-CoA hydratase/carnithine racemase
MELTVATEHRALRTAGDRDGAVQRLELPGGALHAACAAELVDAAAALVEDRTVRVVVVSAAGEFCSGLGDDLDPLAYAPDPAAALARLRVPVVVAVSGACRSVGLEIALAGDIRLAAPSTRFALDDVRRGRLPSWGGTQRLPRAVGTGPATAMLLLGTELDADGARSAGLVHEVHADPLRRAEELVDELLAVGPLAAELAKEAVHRGAELPLRDGLRLEGDLNTLLQSSADRAEGLAAFFAKRPPDFAGR